MSRKPRGKRAAPLYPALPEKTAGIIRYWRDCLQDEGALEISSRDVAASGMELALRQVEQGSAGSTVAKNLVEKYFASGLSRGKRKSKRGADDAFLKDRQGNLRVLICPVRLTKANRAAPGPAHMEVFWIPALLDDAGMLRPPQQGLPWIPRANLEPVIADDDVPIASIEDISSFESHGIAEARKNWASYWEFCKDFFKSVAGDAPERFSLEEYTVRKDAVIVIDPSDRSSSRGLVRLFNEVLAGKRSPGLLGQFANPDEPRLEPYSKSLGALARSARSHSGQFGDKFPLARTQRLAVHRLSETAAGEFLCVTGPPGTGKTTMLQSSIASLWVNAVGGLDAFPPVIVACGATNQSVTNIIDALAKLTSSDQGLRERWLPGVKSYGTFCCSFTKAEEVQGYQLELRDGTGISLRMERLEYLADAEKYYLSRAQAHFGKKQSLRQAVKGFAKQVQAERGKLSREIGKLRDWAPVEIAKLLLKSPLRMTYWELFARLADFDGTIRHRAFLLATHYWEGRWLMHTADVLSQRERSNITAGKFYGKREDWQRRAMVTPAFVSTLAMAPKFFGSERIETEPPADLLIYDEAGQIPVEIGAAVSILARRAVIVGDSMQLEPMYGVPPHLDREILLRHGLLKHFDDFEQFRRLERRKITASSGSFMELALRSTCYSENDKTRGVFLSEHRRSVPAIVAVSNALAYRGRLEPMRPAESHALFPPLAYRHVSGISEKLGHSRFNRQEAEQILGWLEDREGDICGHYGVRGLSEVVAVISPFAAQIRKIRDRLERRFPGMTIGTVHSLQGAERQIVIFSSVYDGKHRGDFFFDRGVNMLNVAVSRAKDAFIVFGDMSIFDVEGSKPSSVLARHLFADPANEIVHLAPPETAAAVERTGLYSTLEEHRESLNEALASAQERVVIVSPTISSHAIEFDRLHDLIASAVARKVQVVVYTDTDLDTREGKLREPAERGRALIKQAGAQLKVAKGIHNKTLMVDRHTVVDGSFNWLSAVRDSRKPFQKLETSRFSQGAKVADEIARLIEQLDYRCALNS